MKKTKYMSDDQFLEAVREIDFSASICHEKNLEALKNKFNEGEIKVMKKKIFKKPAFVAAVIAIALMIPAGVLAGGHVLRHLDTRIVEGYKYVEDYFAIELHVDGIEEHTTVTLFQVAEDAGRIVVEIDGEERVLRDVSNFTVLDEALAHFAGRNLLTPSYLAEGFEFTHASFIVCPVRNSDDETASRTLHLHYSDGKYAITIVAVAIESGGDLVQISRWEFDADGAIARPKENMPTILIGNIQYTIFSDDLTDEQLISIAESLQ